MGGWNGVEYLNICTTYVVNLVIGSGLVPLLTVVCLLTAEARVLSPDGKCHKSGPALAVMPWSRLALNKAQSITLRA